MSTSISAILGPWHAFASHGFPAIAELLVFFTLNKNPEHLASRGGSCQDAVQHGANLGHPGKSVTGGNQRSSTFNYVL